MLRDDALVCYEETAPHNADENVITTTVLSLRDTLFVKARVQHGEAPEFQIRV